LPRASRWWLSLDAARDDSGARRRIDNTDLLPGFNPQLELIAT
jgi:hypothetical protein